MNGYLTTNLHTHTKLCNHASGEEREYVERAAAVGLRTLGFSDHIPIPYDNVPDNVGRVRMTGAQASGYAESVRGLRREFEDRLDLLLGYEGEFLPAYMERQTELIEAVGYDYLILGQHFLLVDDMYVYAGKETQEVSRLKLYVDTCIEGLKTGRYLYLAHPDLINFTGDRDIYFEEMYRLCAFCKENGVPLEVNLHGLYAGKPYPVKEFFRFARENGNELVTGIDAHCPEEIGDMEVYERALGLLAD